MSVYNINGQELSNAYNVDGERLSIAYDIEENVVYTDAPPLPNYNNYSFVQKWASKGIQYTQGFDVYDGKVFWVSKEGNATVPADCYVWNLSDGSQALQTQPITIYSGHGNNLSFDFPILYADSAYNPRIYVNTMTDEFVATLTRTLYLNDGCIDCDACIDPNDSNILWSIGHTANQSYPTAPFIISKWNLANLTDNGDGTYTPEKLQSVNTPQPANSFYIQGCKFHDGMMWYANGMSTGSLIIAVNPNPGDVVHTIDCETTIEPEGIAWVADETAVGGYALYAGFQGMMLRKYTFGALT